MGAADWLARRRSQMGNCLRTAPPQGDNNLEASEAQPPPATGGDVDYGPVKSDVPQDPNAPLSARAGGYNVTTEMLKASDPVKDSQRGMLWPILESIDFTLGPRMSVRKLQDELHNDILICAAIFVANEALTAAFCVYWRPMMWSLFWISLTVGISAVGVFANKTRHTFGLLVFFVLQIMFSAINLQHLNMSHAEALRRPCSQEPPRQERLPYSRDAQAHPSVLGSWEGSVRQLLAYGPCFLGESVHQLHDVCGASILGVHGADPYGDCRTARG